MMQNGGRTSKFGGRCEQFRFWSMLLIFVMVLDENDVFGQNAFAIRISGLQMLFCDFLVHADFLDENLIVVCELYLHVCQQLDVHETKLLLTFLDAACYFWRSLWRRHVFGMEMV